MLKRVRVLGCHDKSMLKWVRKLGCHSKSMLKRVRGLGCHNKSMLKRVRKLGCHYKKYNTANVVLIFLFDYAIPNIWLTLLIPATSLSISSDVL